MSGLRELKKEISEVNLGIKELNSQIKELSDIVNNVANRMSNSLDNTTSEINKTNIAIRDSLEKATEAIKDMADVVGKVVGILTLGGDARNSLIKSLGIENLIPDFFKKKE